MQRAHFTTLHAKVKRKILDLPLLATKNGFVGPLIHIDTQNGRKE